MNESQKTGRLRLRHLQEVTEAKAEQLAELRPRFERLADPVNSPRVVSAFNLFQTPPELAQRLAALVAGRGSILEPSAGLGRLYSAARAMSACPITLVEIAAECAQELYRLTETDPAVRLVQADFLTCDVERLGKFAAVLMNPPFKQGRDIKHIEHARQFLAPGGRLVAVCAAGPRQRERLQPLAEASGGYWEDLPAGSFKESFTNVAAAVVVIEN